MKILFYGDSITDAGRDRNPGANISSYGFGYVIHVAGKLAERDPNKYEIINTGISGNRIVDLYSRIKADLWNREPDVISILIGINDIWHELSYKNGVEPERFEKVYRMLLEDTMKKLPKTKIIICEPFYLPGTATDGHDEFKMTPEYARIAKKLADELGLYFLPLQSVLEEAAKKSSNQLVLSDGVHPNLYGTVVIANEWMKLFDKIENA